MESHVHLLIASEQLGTGKCEERMPLRSPTMGQGGVTENSKVANWNLKALHSFPMKHDSSQGVENVGYTQAYIEQLD